MTPEQRLAKAFELGEMGRELLRAGLRLRHPGATEEEIRALELQEVARCHNRNY
jgi:Rv0078B-related antitoxin